MARIHDILVIDDDPTICAWSKKCSRTASKFNVELAEGGKQGWRNCKSTNPDAIILDLFMPDMNGFALLGKHARKTHALNEIPVIILTGADLTPEQHQQLSEFGKQLLTKGFLREKELLNYFGTMRCKSNLQPHNVRIKVKTSHGISFYYRMPGLWTSNAILSPRSPACPNCGSLLARSSL